MPIPLTKKKKNFISWSCSKQHNTTYMYSPARLAKPKYETYTLGAIQVGPLTQLYSDTAAIVTITGLISSRKRALKKP